MGLIEAKFRLVVTSRGKENDQLRERYTKNFNQISNIQVFKKLQEQF